MFMKKGEKMERKQKQREMGKCKFHSGDGKFYLALTLSSLIRKERHAIISRRPLNNWVLVSLSAKLGIMIVPAS